LGDLLSLTDSGATIQRQLSGEGYKVIGDVCLSFLGFSQNETWQQRFGGDEFKACGLFGRFLPITSTYVELAGLGEGSGDFRDVLRAASDRATGMGRTVCYFGPTVGRGEVDLIGRTMAEVERTEEGQAFQRSYPRDWQNLRGKVIGQAIKMSMIDAFLDGAGGDGAAVDCSPYFRKNAMLATVFYLTYLQQVVEVSALGRKEQKVRELLAKYGTMNKRDIQRQATFYNAGELQTVMDNLKADGVVVEEERVNPNKTRTLVYRLR
jgi:hypothetical protein